MIDECVIAVYPTLEKARDAIHHLADEGFPPNQVSLVTSGVKDKPEIVQQLALSDDSLHDAALLAGLGSVLGVLSGLAAMALSGLGVVFLAGPVGGAIVGSITGGFIGAMAGWGVHKDRIEHYQRLVEKGHALVIANGDPLLLAQAYRLLENTGESELHTYARTGDETPETA